MDRPWVALPWLLILLTAVPAAEALKKKTPDAEELFNPLLGPDYAFWLVGPIYHMASDREVEDFLNLLDDSEAKAFIEAFWQERNKGTKIFQDTPQQIFDQRAVEADKRFTENVYPGRRSDRGTLLILYGEPKEITFESPKRSGDPPFEVWSYGTDASPGLDGRKPKKSYRLIELDGSTVFWANQHIRRKPGLSRNPF